MGQTLSEPVVEKSSAHGEDERMIYGVSAMQGWRISMEDAHTTVLDLLASNPKAAKAHKSKLSFFGVFDGHGGDKVALFAGENIHNIIAKQDTFKAGNYEQALKDGFLATDRAILNDPKYEEEVSGCTACVGLITEDKIYIVGFSCGLPPVSCLINSSICRQMLVTQEAFWVSRVARNRCLLITNHKMKVRVLLWVLHPCRHQPLC
jgi:hypothetical protein